MAEDVALNSVTRASDLHIATPFKMLSSEADLECQIPDGRNLTETPLLEKMSCTNRAGVWHHLSVADSGDK